MKDRGRSRIPALAAGVVLASVVTFAAGPTVDRKLFGGTPPGVTQLSDIGQLQAAFNRASGSTRLVMIFSPT